MCNKEQWYITGYESEKKRCKKAKGSTAVEKVSETKGKKVFRMERGNKTERVEFFCVASFLFSTDARNSFPAEQLCAAQ